MRSAKFSFLSVALAVLCLAAAAGSVSAQVKYHSQEVSESDGIPVLIKHLPDWESLRDKTTFATDKAGLQTALGERPVLDLIEFAGGTEAVTAPYPAGKLLIVEYNSPQLSAEADGIFKDDLDSSTAYRRIGNYNAFVFDVTDRAAAEALLDQVKYEKDIQWLGKNPFRISAERAFVLTTTDIFISTLLWITMGIAASIIMGIVTGLIYFRFRDRRRSRMTAFTDAGGMTRLNLDGFTPEILPEHLLKD